MKFRNLKLSTQYIMSVCVSLFFVILTGLVAHIQAEKIFRQIDILYNHLFQVEQAISCVNTNVLVAQISMRDLLLAQSDESARDALHSIAVAEATAELSFFTIREKYLGREEDVENAFIAFENWKFERERTVNLAMSGNLATAKTNILPSGNLGAYRLVLMEHLSNIEEFVEGKAKEVYVNAERLNISIKLQLYFLVASLLAISLVISMLMRRNLTMPIRELTRATKEFHSGNMDSRCEYSLQNEFGVLSESFNMLARGIQETKDLDNRFFAFSSLLLSKYDAEDFFRVMIHSLAAQTEAQLAAVYLLSDNKERYELFESFGIDGNVRQSFSVDLREGEFGATLASRTIQRITMISEETKYAFNTVSASFIPREIITLPIVGNNEILAIISLASMNVFSMQAMLLLERILTIFSARVEGILAYKKMKEITVKLEAQNKELDCQKEELASQWSEMMQQNSELEMQKTQLDEASRLKTNFLSNMSHELRTPLNSVIALSGVLNRRLVDKIPAEEYSYLEVIERNGKNLLLLINDILDISRIESGREEFEITEFNPTHLVDEVVSMIEPQARQKSIDMTYMSEDADFTIISDADKCRHILQNLIGNAVKFTEKGYVKVIIRSVLDTLTITVIDTGIGIENEHIGHIFDEFRQADSGTSRRFGGSGLGLSIAKKYANLLGGNVSVTSEYGSGSEFTLVLPKRYTIGNLLTGSENNIASPIANDVIGHPLIAFAPRNEPAAKTILLVEDSEPAIVQIQDFLEEMGYSILLAHNGGEALNIISKTIPDAMILDLMMPGIDGFDVLKTVRNAERTAHIPVLILTAKHITKEELKFLKRNNVHQLLQKGDVNRGELQKAIDTMVTKSRHIEMKEEKPVVLVIEDNPDNMLTVKALLSDGYSVLEATEGKAGFDMARIFNPNLVLLDIGLPSMDGIETLSLLRGDVRLQNIPVIALTASAMTTDREAILSHGFDGYISKPIDGKLFFNTLNQVLYGK